MAAAAAAASTTLSVTVDISCCYCSVKLSVTKVDHLYILNHIPRGKLHTN